MPGAAIAAVLLVPLSLPLLLAAAAGRLRRTPCIGWQGRAFARLHLEWRGWPRWMASLGATQWPALWHIVRGDMRWVGPRALEVGEAPPPALLPARQAVPPGLLCLWSLRRRTLIDYGSEWDADAEYLQRRGPRCDFGILLRHALLLCFAPSAGPAAGLDASLQIADVRIDNVTMEQAVAEIVARLDGAGAPAQMCFVNAACVNAAARNRDYRMLLRRAARVLPDGIGLKLAGDLLHTPLRQNVNGTDLFPRLCAAMAASGHSIYLLGGRPGVAEAMAKRVQAAYPGLRIAGWHHGYFSQTDALEFAPVLDAVRASGASLLLVAMGVPLQDMFIARHLEALGARVAIGVGGLFDFMSGQTPRAPQWLRELGGEWIFRLAQEPLRMWQRYLIGNATFLLRVVMQRWGLRTTIRCRIGDASATAIAEDRPDAAPQRRCVLLATEPAPEGFPLPPGTPAALLPL
ncbi:WecB/TagA/CpsF family glycosyltransferase, partial [Ralstonia solanacearum]